MTPDAPRPDLDAAEVRVVARRICAALEVDVMEDGWAEECLGKIAALADAHAELARLRAAPPVHADRLHVIGDHLCAETDGCTCGAGDPHHERYCGLEPIADLAAVRRALAAAPAPAEDEPSWCPTCEVHVVAYSTFTDDKTGWRCCSACTTALTAGPSAPAPAREQADPADEEADRG